METQIGQPLLSEREISVGETFPPTRRTQLNNVWRDYNTFYYGNYKGFVIAGEHLRLEMNLIRYIANFWREFVVPERIEIDNLSAREQELYDILHPILIKATRTVVSDIALYGVGVFDNRFLMDIKTVNPQHWFPVRKPYMPNTPDSDIIASPFIENYLQQSADRIRITKFSGNLSESINYKLDGWTISDQVSPPELMFSPTLPVRPVTLDDTLYGYSLITDVITYIMEIQRRESAISRALDKQSNPHIALPENVVAYDENDNPVIDIEGMVIPLGAEDADPKYVTWEASFEAAEVELDRIMNRIWQLAYISPLLVNPTLRASLPGTLSGVALRRLSIPTTQKIKAFREALTPAIIDVLNAQAELLNLNGGELIQFDIDIEDVDWGAPLEVVGEEELESNEQPSTEQTDNPPEESGEAS